MECSWRLLEIQEGYAQMAKVSKLGGIYKDIVFYIIFGVCTTLVNIIVFWIMAHRMGMSTLQSTIIAWITAVLFAYLTNRKWVFHSKAKDITSRCYEIMSFFLCRLATGVIDWLCMWIFVDILGINDIFMKAFTNILIIALNFIASKLIIFKKS